MFELTYVTLVIVISVCWILARTVDWHRNNRIHWKRELQLLLVYVCLIVVARFTFFPFSKVNGQIQPLVFDAANCFPVRINLIPMINLLDYPDPREALLNVIGNTAMFIPIGIVFPAVFSRLNTAKRALSAGVCFSLAIEILQLPFYDRVSDVDDLLLNSLGYLIGYTLYRLTTNRKRKCPHV